MSADEGRQRRDYMDSCSSRVWSQADFLAALTKEWQGPASNASRSWFKPYQESLHPSWTPQEENSYPTLTVKVGRAAVGLTVDQCAQQLREAKPRIEVLTNDNPSGVSAVREGDDPKAKEKALRMSCKLSQ